MSGHVPQVFYKVYLQIECDRPVAAKRDALFPSRSINFSLLLLSGGGGGGGGGGGSTLKYSI